MAISIKVDEDLPAEVAVVFREGGANAATVASQGWSGLIDADLWPRVQHENRLLATADKGFGDIRRFAPGTHAGIVLFRLERESRAGYVRLARSLVGTVPLDGLSRCLTVVSSGSIRIVRP